MKTIIAGSRDITDYDLLEKVMEQIEWRPTVIISGGARGVDALAERFAQEHGMELEVYHAEWRRYGRKAGYVRNQLMASKADALIALWDGQSKGTCHMIDLAKKHNLKVQVEHPKEDRL